MASTVTPELSIIVPVYNEAAGIEAFHSSLVAVIKDYKNYEIVYVNDGSSDDSLQKLQALAGPSRAVRIISLSRNFGKEIAVTAGIQLARGQAIMTLDADGQYPVELIPKFIEQWEQGSQIVIGMRQSNQKEGFIKRYGSKLFHYLINKYSDAHLVYGSTDYRLIDREVQQAFMRMPERNRTNRGVIDWLGFERSYVPFHAKAREHGEAAYSFKKLFKLAIDSVISLSSSPLYAAAYIGAVIVPFSILLGIFMAIEMAIGDPLNLNITGGGFVLDLELLLIGVLLLSQGIIGLYLSHIHAETQGRPLYVIDETKSIRTHG